MDTTKNCVKTILSEKSVEELEEAGVRDVKTMDDILARLPNKIFYKYYLFMDFRSDMWKVGYHDGEYFLMFAIRVELLDALHALLVAVATHVKSIANEMQLS